MKLLYVQTVELQIGIIKICSRQGNRQVMRHNTDIFSDFVFNMKVCCVFSLESPHRCDSNEYT